MVKNKAESVIQVRRKEGEKMEWDDMIQRRDEKRGKKRKTDQLEGNEERLFSLPLGQVRFDQ